MTQQYQERPPSVTAIQFTGAVECATQINNWLSSYGGIVTHDPSRERALIETPPSGYLTPSKILIAEKTNWVVLHRDGFLDIMKDEDFTFKYDVPEPAPETPSV